jgi:predicted HAD superfamily phosphohydrolase
MVVMSIEEYERQQALLELYSKLSEAEEDIVNGSVGEDFLEVAQKLRSNIRGKI